MKRSTALSSTRMRERAQQSWPAFPKTRVGRGRGGRLEVGVREDHVRGLSAELERHALDRLRGEGSDLPADLGRAGERDLGDVGVLDDPLADRAPGPADDVQDALRQAGIERELARGGAP